MLKEQNKLAEREFFDQQTNWDYFARLSNWRDKSYINFFSKHSSQIRRDI